LFLLYQWDVTGQPLASLYEGEVDDFAVYCPETCAVYLTPMEDLPIRVRGALRVEPPKNRQQKFIRFADR